MNESHAVLLVVIALSFGLNLALFMKLRKSSRAPAPTLEAKELLGNLLRGQATIHIRVLDPENLILRSPRR